MEGVIRIRLDVQLMTLFAGREINWAADGLMSYSSFLRPFTMHWFLARYPRQRFIQRNNNHNALYLRIVSKFNDFGPMHECDWANNTFCL
jgi:hypothetical protein